MSTGVRQLASLDFNSCSSNLQEIRCQVRAAAETVDCQEELVQKLVLVVDEAIANIIRHGYKGSRCGDIRLQISQQRDQLRFELFDWATPVDPECIKPRDLSEAR